MPCSNHTPCHDPLKCTVLQESLLRDCVAAHGPRWTKICNIFRQQGFDRNRKSVQVRWLALQRGRVGKWDRDEDERLKAAVAEHGTKWGRVSTAVVALSFPCINTAFALVNFDAAAGMYTVDYSVSGKMGASLKAGLEERGAFLRVLFDADDKSLAKLYAHVTYHPPQIWTPEQDKMLRQCVQELKGVWGSAGVSASERTVVDAAIGGGAAAATVGTSSAASFAALPAASSPARSICVNKSLLPWRLIAQKLGALGCEGAPAPSGVRVSSLESHTSQVRTQTARPKTAGPACAEWTKEKSLMLML